MGEAFNKLHEFMENSNILRICILDNNNVQFCMHHKVYFPIEEIYKHYDLILVPSWVYAEISESDRRLQYINDISKPLIILDEVSDYLPFVNYQDERLMNVFYSASSPTSRPKRYLKRKLSNIKEQRARAGNGEEIFIEDHLENWIEDYYLDGFDVKETSNGESRKNAGEISILTLAYLIMHRYSEKVKQISISSSDKGVLEIKRNILDFVSKDRLLDVPIKNPIGFLTTDVLLAHAYNTGLIDEETILHLRKNRKFVHCTVTGPDGVTNIIENVLETEEFLEIIKSEVFYHILF